MKKKILSLLIGALLITGITACRNQTEASGAAGTPETTGTSGEAGTAEAKTVIVAVENGSQPLSYVDDNGNVVGYEVDVLAAVDELIPEYEFQLEIVGGDATQIGLETGKYALIGGGLYKTAEREEKYLLPETPNGVSTIKLFVRENETEIQTLDDLVGKKIVPVSPNGGIYNLLTSYNKEHPDAQLTIELSDGSFTTADRLVEISDGIYDALVLPDNLGVHETAEAVGAAIKAVEQPVQINPTYFALAKDQEDLNEKVNEALSTLRENGKLSELNVKWYGEDKFVYLQEN